MNDNDDLKQELNNENIEAPKTNDVTPTTITPVVQDELKSSNQEITITKQQYEKERKNNNEQESLLRKAHIPTTPRLSSGDRPLRRLRSSHGKPIRKCIQNPIR